VVYKTNHDKIEVFCKIHNQPFMTTPNNHIGVGKRGCPKCGIHLSRAEEEIAQALSKALPTEDIRLRDREFIRPYELDIYLPERKIAIEYTGVYFHSTVNPDGKTDRHLYDKYLLAARKGVRIIQVYESEYKSNPELVMRHLERACGVVTDKKVGARKTEIIEIPTTEAQEFFEHNHLQGWVRRSGKIFGLRYHDIVVAMLYIAPVQFTGAARDKGAYEIVRYATSCDVPGGASKLFKHAVKTLGLHSVVSYCDNRWFSGASYAQLGFRLESMGEPSTVVVNKRTMQHVHRMAVTHEKLRKYLGVKYDHTMPHKQLAYKAGFLILYDCGQSKWTWSS
jgi:very-short-patch-repair endonuclease